MVQKNKMWIEDDRFPLFGGKNYKVYNNPETGTNRSLMPATEEEFIIFYGKDGAEKWEKNKKSEPWVVKETQRFGFDGLRDNNLVIFKTKTSAEKFATSKKETPRFKFIDTFYKQQNNQRFL
jgi:hypothetical protein